MAQHDLMAYTMPLEVYFETAVVRGILVTNQDRLSNHLILREGDETFSLRDATLEDSSGRAMEIGATDYIIYMHHVALIADLSPQLRTSRAGFEQLYVKKDPSRAILGVGRYWVEGNVHLTPGATLDELLMARTRFLPVTDAVLIGGKGNAVRTFLLNRSMITCHSVRNPVPE